MTLTEAAVNFWGDRICVGFTDLGGNLDILSSLQTSQTLLFNLYDDPDTVKQISSEITHHWLRYYVDLVTTIQKNRSWNYALGVHLGAGTVLYAAERLLSYDLSKDV
jgi:hypothetical protein